jgi:hypothetical protein
MLRCDDVVVQDDQFLERDTDSTKGFMCRHAGIIFQGQPPKIRKSVELQSFAEIVNSICT